MKPALTKEEWEECGPDDWTLTGYGSDGFKFKLELLSGSRCYATTLPSRHGLAALALHGQPYGFTRADLESVRLAALAEREIAKTDPYPELRFARDWVASTLDDLALRIEALLPPEGVTPLEGRLD